jgi:hypothetical protein
LDTDFKKTERLIAVSKNGEKCAKFTFFFRKNFYLGGKYAVTKLANSSIGGTLVESR